MIPLEEKILLEEIRNRNKKAFKIFFWDYYPCLIRYAEGYIYNPTDCEDLVQNVFIYFWENADQLKIDHSLRSYLYACVKNRCLNYIRDRNIRITNDFVYYEKELRNEGKAELVENETLKIIHSAIEKLPQKMAILFKLKYINGEKITKIAESMNISENTVKTQIYRAKVKIRRSLVKF